MRETPRHRHRSRLLLRSMTLVTAGIALLVLISACAPNLDVQANSKALRVAHSAKPLAEVPHMKATVSDLTTDAILVVAIQPVFDRGGPISSVPIPGERNAILRGTYVVARVGAESREIPIELSSEYFRRPDFQGRKRLGWEVTALVVKELRVRAEGRAEGLWTSQIDLRPKDVPWEVARPFVPGPYAKSEQVVGSGGRYFELKRLGPGAIMTYYPTDGVLDRVEFSMP